MAQKAQNRGPFDDSKGPLNKAALSFCVALSK